MFSELCRETLRKAAVYYNSGRTSASSSPPSSPPPSPQRNSRIVAPETRDVGCSSRSDYHLESGYLPKRTTAVYEIREKRQAHPTNVSSRRTTSGLESRDGRRLPYVASVDLSTYSSSNYKEQPYKKFYYQCHRRGRSASPEMLRNCYFEDRSPGSSPEPDDSSGDEAGAAPDTNSQKSSSTHNRHSLPKDLRRSRSSQFDADSLDGDHPYEHQVACENLGRESSGNNVGTASGGLPKDIDRAKLVRERQQEERQRKLEEIRQQALAAQRFREQRDEERRRRIEELRSRDSDRRSQVEERKRQLWEAERERREAIIRKNQEREARIEAKRKNERSQIVFAFGSSTPRMLEPADTGGSAAAAASSSYWATRRATSTTNVMTSSYSAVGSSPAAQSHHHQASNHGSTLTRRSSERELDGGSKKRATSAGGLDRKPAGDDNDGIPAAGCATRFANRRRTDLVPTLPSPRDPQQQLLTPTSSGRSSSLAKSSPSSAGGLRGSSAGPGLRSGEVTPNSPSSRPPSALSQQNSGATGGSSVNLRPRTTGSARRPRPASIAGTGMSVSCYSPSELKQLKDSKPPLPKVHALQKKPTTPVSTVTPPSSASKSADRKSSVMSRSVRASPRATPKATPLQSPAVEQPPIVQETVSKPKNEDVLEEQKEPEVTVEKSAEVAAKSDENLIGDLSKDESSKQEQKEENLIDVEPVAEKEKNFEADTTMEGDIDEHCDMSASMIQKIRITTEEEAKAALAERRRLAREQAEREAELERLRLEEEARLEAERQRAEEEEQRRLEEETLRLAEEARKAEEQRLQQAIEEAKRREEEDRKRREEEARLKAEKEEAERKAREEAEKQRLEMVEKLKKEEEERIARRKRVEAIMSRTRAKNQPNSSNKYDGNDGEKSKETSPNEEMKPNPGQEDNKTSPDLMTASLISEATQQFITDEKKNSSISTATDNNSSSDESSQKSISNGTHVASNGIDSNNTSETTINTMTIKPTQNLLDNVDNGQELNGHHGNGIDSTQPKISLDNATVKQNNVTNNLLDLSEFDMLSDTNNSNNTSNQILLMTNEDNLNSNLNPAAMEFTPSFGIANTNSFHQDPFVSKQQDNQLPDLLS
ncbi:MAP7 domain-containing protein 2-like isoform X6 [Trichogramma pretiosum]|uniref:MAP7 domain-containing protein 2-like isoform X6 n=1 Tax=Trichogramma pretiosum TaxID=7493 RepID=UPI0006C9B9FC|nr:MAP7 domain-containing protein 2-like isoform X6 [Trichogramma pretiosum]